MGSKPPFGYVKSPEDKHLLVIDPPAAEIVKRLFREFAGGDSGRATKLNDEGVYTPAEYYFKQTRKRATRGDNGQQWGSTTIKQLLKNQIYIDNMVQCKRKVSSFKTKKRLVTSPDDWVVVEDTHEPIIDRFTWDCVQRRMETTKRAPSNNTIKTGSTDEVNIFSGIIRCADCGAAMAFVRRERKNGRDKMFYRCSRYNNGGKEACSTHTIDAEVLESVVLADIQYHAKMAVKNERRLFDRLLSFSGQEQEHEKAAQEKALRDATNRVSFIEDASKRLFEEKITGNVPDILFKNMLSDYEKGIDALEEKSENIKRQLQDQESGEVNAQKWIKLIKSCVSIDRLDRATAFQLIDQVAVHEQQDKSGHTTQTVQIKYNFVGDKVQ